MFIDTAEPGFPVLPYPQNVELFGMNAAIGTEPADFRSRFDQVRQGIYPGQAIESMKADGYNPMILGYTHDHPDEQGAIQRKLSELMEQSCRPLSVQQEVDPQQLQWIKDFWSAETEFRTLGTIGGKSVRLDEAQRMGAYRARLRANHSEGLSLWCLDNGMGVKSMEHPQVKQ